MFSLHPQLAQDTFFVGDFPLSTCRLMNDMQFPWLILIPRVPGVSELYEFVGLGAEGIVATVFAVMYGSNLAKENGG